MLSSHCSLRPNKIKGLGNRVSEFFLRPIGSVNVDDPADDGRSDVQEEDDGVSELLTRVRPLFRVARSGSVRGGVTFKSKPRAEELKLGSKSLNHKFIVP